MGVEFGIWLAGGSLETPRFFGKPSWELSNGRGIGSM